MPQIFSDTKDFTPPISGGWPHARLDELLPHIWAKSNPQHVRPPPDEH
ncbi:MAG: hypothetical protein HY904_22055 [Deltaproteobacteria bacterium]|nr:hypothetical protein [Deltaproteobacteria bacterium]